MLHPAFHRDAGVVCHISQKFLIWKRKSAKEEIKSIAFVFLTFPLIPCSLHIPEHFLEKFQLIVQKRRSNILCLSLVLSAFSLPQFQTVQRLLPNIYFPIPLWSICLSSYHRKRRERRRYIYLDKKSLFWFHPGLESEGSHPVPGKGKAGKNGHTANFPYSDITACCKY